jgi:hypothetical protein
MLKKKTPAEIAAEKVLEKVKPQTKQYIDIDFRKLWKQVRDYSTAVRKSREVQDLLKYINQLQSLDDEELTKRIDEINSSLSEAAIRKIIKDIRSLGIYKHSSFQLRPDADILMPLLVKLPNKYKHVKLLDIINGLMSLGFLLEIEFAEQRLISMGVDKLDKLPPSHPFHECLLCEAFNMGRSFGSLETLQTITKTPEFLDIFSRAGSQAIIEDKRYPIHKKLREEARQMATEIWEVKKKSDYHHKVAEYIYNRLLKLYPDEICEGNITKNHVRQWIKPIAESNNRLWGKRGTKIKR